jgi:hypothetical protein
MVLRFARQRLVQCVATQYNLTTGETMNKSKKQMLKEIESPDHFGWLRKWKDKGDILEARILKRVAIAEKNFPQINVIDLIEFTKEKSREIRFGYYTVSRHGKWLWGQYCPCYPKRDLKRLLAKAKKAGII